MRSLLEEEEEKAAEITLSSASLLGIFFGLVLVCGVFFGFGYSMGRGNGQATEASLGAAAASTTPDETATTQSPQPAAVVVPAQPREAVQPPPPPVKRAQSDEAEEAPGEDAVPAPPRHISQALAAALKPDAAVNSPVGPAPVVAPVADMSPVSGQPMVQIAAVARQEDADVLVSALRQRGYGVVVRNEPQDKLLHVQVGPFADRGQATAIKQKLLSDGYNAIIKQ